MKKKNRNKAVLLTALISLGVISCEKEEQPDTNAPAYKIAASEKLFIPAEVTVPANLPAGNSRIATFYAEGVQKYKAQAKAGGGLEWVFVAPLADLYDAGNRKIGTHGAGPFWALTAADSVFAQAFTPAKTASPDAGSVPWLLLMPKAGKTPGGIFTGTAYIQRIATTGGKAPATAPGSITDTVDVFYTAIYRFTRIN